MKRHCIHAFAAAAFLFLVIMPIQGRADTYYFYNITNNGSDLTDQLTVDVTHLEATGQVSFLFENDVGTPSSICDVYFYDGTYISGYPEPGDPAMIETGDVSFTPPASPGDLSGYNPRPPTLVYSADSDSSHGGVWANGINANNESLELIFNLYSGTSYDSLLAGLDSGQFVVGLRVQGTDGANPNDGDSYVTFVPVPAAVLLGMLGLGAAGLKLRKFV